MAILHAHATPRLTTWLSWPPTFPFLTLFLMKKKKRAGELPHRDAPAAIKQSLRIISLSAYLALKKYHVSSRISRRMKYSLRETLIICAYCRSELVDECSTLKLVHSTVSMNCNGDMHLRLYIYNTIGIVMRSKTNGWRQKTT